MVVVADWRASSCPRPGSRPPRPRHQSSDASGSRHPRPYRGGPQQTTRRRGAAGAASLPLTPWCHLGQRNCLPLLCPCPRGEGPRQRRWEPWRGRCEPRRQAGGLQPAHRRSGSHGEGPGHRSSEPPRRSRRGSAAWPRLPSLALDCRRARGCPGEGLGTRGRRTHQ
jgi:hypothetical protein